MLDVVGAGIVGGGTVVVVTVLWSRSRASRLPARIAARTTRIAIATVSSRRGELARGGLGRRASASSARARSLVPSDAAGSFGAPARPSTIRPSSPDPADCGSPALAAAGRFGSEPALVEPGPRHALRRPREPRVGDELEELV